MDVLRIVAGATGAVVLAGALVAAPAGAAQIGPDGRLTKQDAQRVRVKQFTKLAQFRAWHEQLDALGPAGQKGLRAAGSEAEAQNIDNLVADLRAAGVKRVHTEPAPMTSWIAESWALDLLDGVTTEPVRTASYIPFSGQTGVDGVTGELVYVDPEADLAPDSLRGKIALFDVPLPTLTIGMFAMLEYPGGRYDPRGQYVNSDKYARPYLNGVRKVMTKLQEAGATAAIGILNYPQAAADGSYFPYDGIIRSVPALYVDRQVGTALKQRAGTGVQARVTLPAQVAQTTSRNIVGFIPGTSKQLIGLHSHTDGTNAIEDNGPQAIVAMAQYLARLPKKSLDRTVMVVLTTGHFAGGAGVTAFRQAHQNDLVKRTKAIVTVEHLGTKEWQVKPDGSYGPTGKFEPAAMFMPNAPGVVKASIKTMKRSKAGPVSVLRPFRANTMGPEDAWPGEGQYFYWKKGLVDANYITGPTYLLNWGITTADKVSLKRVRRQSVGFTQMILDLTRVPAKQFRVKR